MRVIRLVHLPEGYGILPQRHERGERILHRVTPKALLIQQRGYGRKVVVRGSLYRL